jgi:type I restriction enzyme S subunit
LHVNTVIFAKIGEAIRLNRRVILGTPSLVDNNVMGVKAKECLQDKYLFYFFCTIKLGDLSRATTVPSIRKSDVEEIVLPVPPIPEQKRIVAKIEELFTRLDAGVENLKKTRQLLKNYRQAVLRDAFTGKLTGKINHKDTKAPRELPDGWKLLRFENIIAESQNGLSKRNSSVGTPVHVIRLADITDGQLQVESPRDIMLTDTEVSKYVLRQGDILCIRVNGSPDLVGRLIQFKENDAWAYCDHFIRYRFKNELILPQFIVYYSRIQFVRNFIDLNKVSSAGQNTVSQKTIGAMPVPVPSIQEQKQIILEIERHFSIADAVEKEIDEALKKSDSLRQSILKSAFEGKLVATESTHSTSYFDSAQYRSGQAKSIKYPEFSPGRLQKVAEGNKKYL